MDRGKKKADSWESSYETNNFGELFYSLIRIYKPKLIVELGTKAGYSAYHMAWALKENGFGEIHCYDLWDLYEFTSYPKAEAEENLKDLNCVMHQQDARGVHLKYDSVDFLHIDLSNHAELLENIVPLWLNKVNQLMIIEGGSEQRDRVEWMKRYAKKPIKQWLVANRDKFDYVTISPFPSLTLIRPH